LVINAATGNITASGNVTAAYFYGDGSNITNLPLANNTSNISGNNISITGNGTFADAIVWARNTSDGNRVQAFVVE
jgi:hypothetical protein